MWFPWPGLLSRVLPAMCTHVASPALPLLFIQDLLTGQAGSATPPWLGP